MFFFSQEKLRAIAVYLNLVPPPNEEETAKWCRLDEIFLRELLVRTRVFNFAKNT